MKVVIAGGSGFLGRELADHFKEEHEVVIFTRGASKVVDNIKFIQWDASTKGDWIDEMEDVELLINLTGKSVDCRYTDENKKEIIRSRVESTHILGEVIETLKTPPRVWLNSSTATIYRYSEDKEMDEENGEIGNDFSMNVAKSWEVAFYKSNTPKTRKVALRISLVLGKSGGVYPVLRRLAKFGLAGKMGSGKQRFSWIHIQDLLRAIDFIIENENIEGPVNCTAPEIPTNGEFMKGLRKSLKVAIGIPQPKIMLKIGGFIIRTESELVLKSRWVIPRKLQDHGFKFQYSDPENALKKLS